MPQPRKAARFGGSPAHHNLMMASIATELIRHGQIRTTHAKAKTVQPLAERMITFAKRGDLHARRQVLKVIRDKDVVHKLFETVGPAFAERDGGYTRVLKLGPRKGDAAPMALISLVEGVAARGEGELEEAPRRRWSLRRRRGTQSVTARERSEERAAAVDRGEEPDVSVTDLDEEEPAGSGVDDERLAGEEVEEDLPGEEEFLDDTDEESDGQRVQADPAEVEARLAAQEEAEEAEVAEADAAKEVEASEELSVDTDAAADDDEEQA